MNNLVLFESKQVRRTWSEDEQKWFFSIDDVVAALTDSVNVKDYIKKLRKRDSVLNSYWGTNCPLVEMRAVAGKKGGGIARRARVELEDKTDRKVVTGENFLPPAKRNHLLGQQKEE